MPTVLNELERLMAEAHPMAPIPGITGYMAGSDGHIWSFTNWRGRGISKLAESISRDGYPVVCTRVSGRGLRRQVHRLICTAFHGAKKNRQHQVRHLNGIKTDNRPCNLAWGTAKENAEDRDRHETTARGESNGFSKLTSADVLAARRFHEKGMPMSIMASFLGVSTDGLSLAVHKKSWRHVQNQGGYCGN